MRRFAAPSQARTSARFCIGTAYCTGGSSRNRSPLSGPLPKNAKPADEAGLRPRIGDIGKAVSINGHDDRNQALGLLDDEITGSGLARATIDQDLVRDRLAFGELIDASALDSTDVDENVLAAVVGLDESVALLTIEPLYSAACHFESLSTVIEPRRRAA